MKRYIMFLILNVFFYYFSKADNKQKKCACSEPPIEVNFLKEKISLDYSLLAGLDSESAINLMNTDCTSVEKKDVKMENIGALNYGENIFKFVNTADHILVYDREGKYPLGVIVKKNLKKEGADNEKIFGFDLLSEQNKDAKIALILNNGKHPYLINVKLNFFLQYTHPYLNNGYLCGEDNINIECILVPLNYKKAHIMPKLYFYDIKNKLLLRRSILVCKYNEAKKSKLKIMLNSDKSDIVKKGITDTELDLIYDIMCLKSRDDNVPSLSRYAVFGRYLVKYYKYDEDISAEEQENIIGTAEKVDDPNCKYKLVAITLREFKELLNNSKYFEVINCNFYKNKLESDYLKISKI